MALLYADLILWQHLASKRQIPLNPRVLEIGEANVHPSAAKELLNIVPENKRNLDAFASAKEFYSVILGYQKIVSIDFTGKDALRFDLNYPIPETSAINCKFDITINSGTTEHVFNQAQVFKTIHDYTVLNGLMIHAVPTSGWHDHGLFSYTPRFFKSLAEANGYETLLAFYWVSNCDTAYGETIFLDEFKRNLVAIENSLLYVALRKSSTKCMFSYSRP